MFASLPAHEHINSGQPTERVMITPDACTKSEKNDTPHDLSLPPPFDTRPVKRIKFLKTPKENSYRVTHDYVYYTVNELFYFSNSNKEMFEEASY